MNIKQIGDYLEVECCNCGEILLVGDGDRVNVRVGLTFESEKATEVPDGFLCYVCHKSENKKENFVQLKRKKCSCCGKICDSDFDSNNFYPKFNKNGEFDGFFCSDCF